MGAKLLSQLAKGAYNGATAYTVGDLITYTGNSYVCIANSTGNLPTDTAFWALLASKGADGAGISIGGANANEITYFEDATTIGSLDVATYPSLTELTRVKGVTSAVQTQIDAKLATSAYDDATTAETNTGTSTTKYVSPDGLAGSYAGTKSVSIQVVASDVDVTTGDGKAFITIPEALNGMNLVRATATVYTAGTTNATTIMVRNKTDAVDMLSGSISIASGGTVATAGTINGATDDVTTNDVIAIDVDAVSTTKPQGLSCLLEFKLP